MGLLLPIATSVVRRFNFIMSVNLPKGGIYGHLQCGLGVGYTDATRLLVFHISPAQSLSATTHLGKYVCTYYTYP